VLLCLFVSAGLVTDLAATLGEPKTGILSIHYSTWLVLFAQILSSALGLTSSGEDIAEI